MHSKAFRYTMFGLLYFTQGTVLGYFVSLNALYLLDRGLTMANVGIFSLIAMLPFVIKIFMGLLSDKVNLLGMGHRRPYIFIGLFVQTLCLIIVPFINPASNFPLFVFMAFMLQMGMALYDTCTDALAIDTTPEEEEGIIQGFMVGGRAVGTILLASVVGQLANQGLWQYVFWLLAVLTLLPLPFVIKASEPKKVEQREFKWSAFANFKQVRIILLSSIGFLIFFIIAGVNQVMNPYLTATLDINLATAGNVASVWGIGVVAGALLTGWLIKQVGFNRILFATIIVGGLSVAGLLWITDTVNMWAFVLLFGYGYGSYQTIYFAMSMNNVVPGVAATMYSIFMAISNIGQGVGMAVIGGMVKQSHYTQPLLIFAGLNILILPMALWFLALKKPQTTLETA
jgi:MFS transporter, PAT family, beta-lactamase induction signal transducer AmpG